ncbi:TRAP transporter large permease subunit [Tistrella bauzanensis]|uniref:TRAP transporter large permease protein n=1 Tax=Tistrella arctica TaxID=3133430 RepID=A0ABU9YL28_9PROT
MTAAMLLAMLVLLGLSVPVGIAVGLASAFGVYAFTKLPLLIVVQQLFIAIDKFPLVAVPFFILAGNIMERAGISYRLVDFAKSLVGGMRGGLAVTCVLTCMIFAAVSGSSVATTFAIGAILIPALAKHGYPRPYAASVQAVSAELGVIVPPSIPLILYGVSAEVSIGELFIAGFGPGLLIAGALAVTVVVWSRMTGWGAGDGLDRLPVMTATRRAFASLMLPVVVLGGIYGGVFTPTEASVVAVVAALMIGFGVHRELKLRDLPVIFRKSVISSAVIMFIIAAAGLFSYLITQAGVPAALGRFLADTFAGPLGFLVAVNIVLFLVGMFIETSASIIVLAPILAPVAISFGIDPVHFGIIMVVNLAMGMFTPPFGVNLFAASAVAQVPLNRMVRYLLPFIAVVLACQMLITYWSPLALTLRDLIYR